MKYLLLLAMCLVYPLNAMELKATVNDVPISDLDVARWERLLLFQQPQKYEPLSKQARQKEALDAAIESAVKKQAAMAHGLKVTAKEIEQARAHLEQQNGLAEGTLTNVLKEHHVADSTLRAQIESDLLWLQYVRGQANNLKVSDLAVEKRYNAMKNDLKKQGIEGNNITLWEMAQGVFSEDVDVSTTLESKTCEAFLEHIKIGPYPDSAQRGWTDPNQMPPELRELLNGIAVRETLGPLRTPNGILVMMKCDVKTQQVMPTKEQLKMQMEMEQIDVLSRRLLSEATRRAVIERKN